MVNILMILKLKKVFSAFFVLFFLLSSFCNNAEAKTSDNFNRKLSSLCWIAYAPTNFDPTKKKYPLEKSIRKDLILLKKEGINGIVTFGSEKILGRIPEIAKEVGFTGVIMGIWEPNSSEEIKNAKAAKKFVDAYCVGHMGLGKRYNLKTLEQTKSEIEEDTGKPVSISESMQLYKKGSKLLEIGDWVFPDAHLFWDTGEDKSPKSLFDKLVKEYERLVGFSEKPVLIKTVGFPSSGAHSATEVNQSRFFKLIVDNAKYKYERVLFVYFEAYDQKWKEWHSVESHWGVFYYDRTPKHGSSYIWGRKYKYNNLPKSLPINVGEYTVFIVISSIALLFTVFFYIYRTKIKKARSEIGKRCALLLYHFTVILFNKEKETKNLNIDDIEKKVKSNFAIDGSNKRWEAQYVLRDRAGKWLEQELKKGCTCNATQIVNYMINKPVKNGEANFSSCEGSKKNAVRKVLKRTANNIFKKNKLESRIGGTSDYRKPDECSIHITSKKI